MCDVKNNYVWLLEVIALLGLLALCLWLSLRPKSPSYSITYVSIPQTNNGQNDTIFYGIEIENPNKDSSIFHDDIVLSFLYGQDKVGETTIPSFHQGRGKSRGVFDSVSASHQPLKAMSNAISNATAELKVALLTRIRYKTLGIKSKFHVINLQGVLPIDSGGKLSNKKNKYKLRSASRKFRRSRSMD